MDHVLGLSDDRLNLQEVRHAMRINLAILGQTHHSSYRFPGRNILASQIPAFQKRCATQVEYGIVLLNSAMEIVSLERILYVATDRGQSFMNGRVQMKKERTPRSQFDVNNQACAVRLARAHTDDVFSPVT
jgi:hypothetical protein